MDSYCIKGIIRINEEVNKDAEHWIMSNLIVFSLFMRKFEATKDIFCAKLVFIYVLKQRSIIKQNIIIFHLKTASKI